MYQAMFVTTSPSYQPEEQTEHVGKVCYTLLGALGQLVEQIHDETGWDIFEYVGEEVGEMVTKLAQGEVYHYIEMAREDDFMIWIVVS